jgi:hypothetical protein
MCEVVLTQPPSACSSPSPSLLRLPTDDTLDSSFQVSSRKKLNAVFISGEIIPHWGYAKSKEASDYLEML